MDSFLTNVPTDIFGTLGLVWRVAWLIRIAVWNRKQKSADQLSGIKQGQESNQEPGDQTAVPDSYHWTRWKRC